MFCRKCGSRLNEGAAFCSRCGARVGPVQQQAAPGYHQVAPVPQQAAPALVQPQTAGDVSPKSRLATSLLAVFVGEFGAHRFYAGKVRTAVTMLILGVAYLASWCGVVAVAATSGDDGWPTLLWVLYGLGIVLGLLLGIWSLVDFIMAVTGNFKDSHGRPITKW